MVTRGSSLCAGTRVRLSFLNPGRGAVIDPVIPPGLGGIRLQGMPRQLLRGKTSRATMPRSFWGSHSALFKGHHMTEFLVSQHQVLEPLRVMAQHKQRRGIPKSQAPNHHSPGGGEAGRAPVWGHKDQSPTTSFVTDSQDDLEQVTSSQSLCSPLCKMRIRRGIIFCAFYDQSMRCSFKILGSRQAEY